MAKLPLLQLLVLFFWIVLTAMPAQAHISPDMPDPIAQVEYQILLDFQPDDLLTRYKLAMVYYRLNKDTLCESELREVLRQDPNHFHALEGLGMLQLRRQHYEDAVLQLAKAIRQKERESGTYYYLAKALQNLRRFAEAETALETGLERLRTESEAGRAIPMEQFRQALTELHRRTTH